MRLGLDRGNLVAAGLNCGECTCGALGIRQRELRELLAVEFRQPRFEFRSVDGQARSNIPVFLRDELLDLDLAIDHDAQRHRLHASSRARAWQLAPQDGREREAHEIVERAAGEIGVHQLLVDLARVLDRFRYRLLGYGVERHALDRLALQHLAVVERLEHMPRDRLALAIRVGCEDQTVGFAHRIGDFLDVLDRLSIDVPRHREVLVGLHGTVFRGQVPDVAVRRHHLVPGAQVLVDGFDLSRRLYDDNLHFSSYFQCILGEDAAESGGRRGECQFAGP